MKDIDPKCVVGIICALGLLGLIVQLPSPWMVEHRPSRSSESHITPHVESDRTAPTSSSPAIVPSPRLPLNPKPAARIVESPIVPSKSAEELAVERAAQAERERREFVERYVNVGVARTPGKRSVALMTFSEGGMASGAVNAALSKRVKSDSVEVIGSLLKGAFVNDGLCNQVFGGSLGTLEQLELAKNADALFLARHAVEYTKSPSLENVITASMKVETQVIHLGANTVAGGWTFQSSGAGFTEVDARRQAEERLVKQIEKDTQIRVFPE